MPIYEYKCRKCGGTFEVLQKFSDRPLTTHEGCGGAVERLLSPPGLQFKGTGWYVTDYAHGSKGGNGNSKKKSEPVTPPAKTESSSASTPPSSKS
jgi:putative FmdB family regulatory protein